MTEIFKEIDNLVKTNDVILFMKGSAAMPQCGFSKQVADILKKLNVSFKDIDVLKSLEMRQGIKDYTDWPTVPQLYVKGEFVGGCDIVREMLDNGELEALFDPK